MPGDQAERERAIRAALQHPGSRDRLPDAKRAPQPVVLWLHPAPPVPADGTGSGAQDDGDAGERQQGKSKELEDQRRRPAERTDMPEEDRGLITVRMENIFTWGEFVKVDRGAEENEDLDEAASAAEDMEKFSVTRDGESVAGDRLCRDLLSGARDLACLLLADLSLSTDAWINDQARLLYPHGYRHSPCQRPARRAAGRRVPAPSVWQRRLCGHSPSLAVTPGVAVAVCSLDCLKIVLKNAGCFWRCVPIRAPDFLFPS